MSRIDPEQAFLGDKLERLIRRHGDGIEVAGTRGESEGW